SSRAIRRSAGAKRLLPEEVREVRPERPPLAAPPPEPLPSRSRKRVLLPSAPSLSRFPGPIDQPLLLEVVQDGIEGPVVECEEPPAALLDLERDLVAVARPLPQRRQEQKLVEAPRQPLDLDPVRHRSPSARRCPA